MRLHIGIDWPLVAGNRLDQSGIGAIPGLAKHAGRRLHEARKIGLEFELWTFAVQKNARHQHAVAVVRQRARHCREDLRMPRQGQIVVTAQMQGVRAGLPSMENVPTSPGISHPLAVIVFHANGEEFR